MTLDATQPCANAQTISAGRRSIVSLFIRQTGMIDSQDSSRRMIVVLSWIALIAMLALLTVGAMSLVRSLHDDPSATQIGPLLKAR